MSSSHTYIVLFWSSFHLPLPGVLHHTIFHRSFLSFIAHRFTLICRVLVLSSSVDCSFILCSFTIFIPFLEFVLHLPYLHLYLFIFCTSFIYLFILFLYFRPSFIVPSILIYLSITFTSHPCSSFSPFGVPSFTPFCRFTPGVRFLHTYIVTYHRFCRSGVLSTGIWSSDDTCRSPSFVTITSSIVLLSIFYRRIFLMPVDLVPYLPTSLCRYRSITYRFALLHIYICRYRSIVYMISFHFLDLHICRYQSIYMSISGYRSNFTPTSIYTCQFCRSTSYFSGVRFHRSSSTVFIEFVEFCRPFASSAVDR